MSNQPVQVNSSVASANAVNAANGSKRGLVPIPGIMNKIKTALGLISEMRNSTSTQAEKSGSAASNALNKAQKVAAEVEQKTHEIENLQTTLEAKKKAHAESIESGTRELATLKQTLEEKVKDELEKARTTHEQEVAAAKERLERESEETLAKRDAEIKEAQRKLEEEQQQETNEIARLQSEIKKAIDERNDLAKRANIEADAAAKYATAAASKKMANYANNSKVGSLPNINKNHPEQVAAKNERNAQMKALNNADPNKVSQPSLNGGRRHKLRMTRRVFRKKHGTKRR
jgi:chromosome segregation ATPase